MKPLKHPDGLADFDFLKTMHGKAGEPSLHLYLHLDAGCPSLFRGFGIQRECFAGGRKLPMNSSTAFQKRCRKIRRRPELQARSLRTQSYGPSTQKATQNYKG
jgi:hypothetical protein